MGFLLRAAIVAMAVMLAAPHGFAAERVRVAMPSEGFLYTPFYLAIDAGFMKEEGIDPELIQFRGGGAAISGLASSNVELCTCAIQNAINAKVRGSDIKIIGTIIGQYASNLVLREDVARRLRLTPQTPIPQRLAALRGLKIAGSGAGSSTDFLIRYLAQKAGLSTERDLTVLFLGAGGPLLAAFSQGRIDGFVFSSPTSDAAVVRYKGVLVLDMSRGEFEDLRGYPSIALAAKSSWLGGKRPVAEKILRAIAKADRMIHAEPARAKQLLRARFSGIAEDVYAAAWEANVAAYPATPRVDEASVRRAIAFLTTVARQNIPGAPADYFDNSYADQALKTLQ